MRTLLFILFLLFSARSFASVGRPFFGNIRAITDTVPPPQVNSDNNYNAGGAKPNAIKEVPKAKNQVKPQAINVASIKVRPVKIIRPKIRGLGK